MDMLQSLEAIKKILVYLFGSGRFFLYFAGVMWIFRKQITDTVLYNQIRDKVKDFLFWYEYRTKDRELITFIDKYFDNYVFSLVNDKNYKQAREAKRKRKRAKYYEELCDDIMMYFPHIHYNDSYEE